MHCLRPATNECAARLRQRPNFGHCLGCRGTSGFVKVSGRRTPQHVNRRPCSRHPKTFTESVIALWSQLRMVESQHLGSRAGPCCRGLCELSMRVRRDFASFFAQSGLRELSLPYSRTSLHLRSQRFRKSAIFVRRLGARVPRFACSKSHIRVSSADALAASLGTRARFFPISDFGSVARLTGWGGRVRTSECRNQNPVPYHLATPQYAPA